MPVSILPITLEGLGGLNVLLYGPFGAGKTRLAGSAANHPELQDVLFIDIDQGLKTVVHQPHLLRAKISKSIDVLDVFKQLQNPNDALKDSVHTVVIDSVTAWKDDDINAIADREYKSPSTKKGRGSVDEIWMSDYKEMTARLTRLIANFRNTDKTLIIIAGEYEEGKKTDMQGNVSPPTLIRPAVNPALLTNINHMVDGIWYMRQTDGMIRMLTQERIYQNGTPDGLRIVGKTRNENFAARLQKEAKDGYLVLGNANNLDEKYPDFGTIYEWYKSAVAQRAN
jgi:hypothetical protein